MTLKLLVALLVLCLPVVAQSDSVAVKRDIVYATYGAKSLRLDLYTPKGVAGAVIPGIIAVRGGGWRMGDKNGFAKIASALAVRGFAVACIEYRVLPEFTITNAVNDTKAAVRWMRAEGKQYGIQTDSIGVIGGSAGGHLVALLGTSHKAGGLEGDGGHAGVSSRVQAVVAMAPVVDFETFGAAQLFPGEPELAKLLSPVTHLDKEAAPILLLHSDGDQTVPIAQSNLMVARYKQEGVSAAMDTVKGGTHAFWNSPQTAEWVIARSAVFFHSKLDRP